jgi:hypothetical protein
MARGFVTLVLLFEPLHFAFEVLRVAATIPYRGLTAVIELVLHATVAVLCAGAAVAFSNDVPGSARLMTIAVVASVARTIQSVYWSSLPDDTRPGDEIYVAMAAIGVGALAIVVGRWKARMREKAG